MSDSRKQKKAEPSRCAVTTGSALFSSVYLEAAKLGPSHNANVAVLANNKTGRATYHGTLFAWKRIKSVVEKPAARNRLSVA